MNTPHLRLIALEITRTCTLHCKHCRGNSQDTSYADELTFGEIQSILDNAASFSNPIIIITGGEPLTREDVFDITAYSTSLGLRTVLATCGHFLNDETVQNLIDTGISRISVSLDGATPEVHDNFRGMAGAFETAIRGITTARNHGLEFQINSTLTAFNIDDIEALHDLACSLGAAGFHPFLLVPMGRGSDLVDCALSPEEYEDAIIRIAKIAAHSPLEIKPTCCPHYSRVIRQMNTLETPISPSSSTSPKSAKGNFTNHTAIKGCIGGKNFIFISHIGKVQICGFLEVEAGDLRNNNYDLQSIWETSEFLNEIRRTDDYQGKCGICEYRNVCGGCRARAYYSSGDYMGVEPKCIYIPGTAMK